MGGRLQGLKRKKLFYTIREMRPVSSSLDIMSEVLFLEIFGRPDRFRVEHNLEDLSGGVDEQREAFSEVDKVISSASDFAVLRNLSRQ